MSSREPPCGKGMERVKVEKRGLAALVITAALAASLAFGGTSFAGTVQQQLAELSAAWFACPTQACKDSVHAQAEALRAANPGAGPAGGYTQQQLQQMGVSIPSSPGAVSGGSSSSVAPQAGSAYSQMEQRVSQDKMLYMQIAGQLANTTDPALRAQLQAQLDAIHADANAARQAYTQQTGLLPPSWLTASGTGVAPTNYGASNQAPQAYAAIGYADAAGTSPLTINGQVVKDANGNAIQVMYFAPTGSNGAWGNSLASLPTAQLTQSQISQLQAMGFQMDPTGQYLLISPTYLHATTAGGQTSPSPSVSVNWNQYNQASWQSLLNQVGGNPDALLGAAPTNAFVNIGTLPAGWGGGSSGSGSGGGTVITTTPMETVPVTLAGVQFNPNPVEVSTAGQTRQVTATVKVSGPVTDVQLGFPWGGSMHLTRASGDSSSSTWTGTFNTPTASQVQFPQGKNWVDLPIAVQASGGQGQKSQTTVTLRVWEIAAGAGAPNYGAPTTGSGAGTGTAPTNPGSGTVSPGSGTGTGTGTGTGPSQLIK